MPKKPNRPFVSIAFSDTGKVSHVIERTDLEQCELDYKIAEKFLASLKHFRNIELKDLRFAGRGGDDNPQDVEATSEDGSKILIQITEVVDQASRAQDELRDKLRQSLASSVDLQHLYGGCRITLIVIAHRNKKHSYAALRNKIIQSLIDLGKSIETLLKGKKRGRRVIDDDNYIAHVSVDRFAEKQSGFPMQVAGAGRSMALTKTNWLLNTIQRKRYSKPLSQFWLLAYSRDVLYDADHPHILEAESVLNCTPHPFDQVWFLFPYPNRNLGGLLLVWQRDKHA